MHLNDQFVDQMLFLIGVPLEFAIPAVTKDAYHLSGGLSERFKTRLVVGYDLVLTVPKLPEVGSIDTAHTSRGGNHTLTMLTQYFIINSWEAEEVFI